MRTQDAPEFPGRRAAVLCGLGGYLPSRVLDNAELSSRMDTSDEWIRTRTGIGTRRVADDMSTVDMAIEAGRAALSSASLDRVDALVLATSTPDYVCPASAPQVAAALGLSGIAAFDVNAVCSGFVYALATAAGMISAGISGSVLVVGADKFTAVVDPDDRGTAPIFGDGAGAIVLRAGLAEEDGALGPFDLHSEGEGTDLLYVPAGGVRQRFAEREQDKYVIMQGQKVFRQACARMAESSRTVLGQAGWPVDGVDRFVGHQANIRILDAVAKKLGLPPEAVVANIGTVGNTVAASVPLALLDGVKEGQLVPGHRVLISAFGAGLTWGSTVLRWPEVTPG